MIKDFKELDFKEGDTPQETEQKLQEKLGISIKELKEALCASVIDRAEELTHDFVSIAPLGNYEKLLEDNESMAEFLKTEACKPEHWKLHYLTVNEAKSLLEFAFVCTAVDNDDFVGFVFVSETGKIRHAFAQNNL